MHIKTSARYGSLLWHAILIVASSAIAVGPIFLFVEMIGYTQGRSFPQTLSKLVQGLGEVWIIVLFLLTLCVLCLQAIQKALDIDPAEDQIPYIKNEQDNEVWVIPPKLKRLLVGTLAKPFMPLKRRVIIHVFMAMRATVLLPFLLTKL